MRPSRTNRITIKSLRRLGFEGPYPHGEFYLFDPSQATRIGNCCIMQVYPPGMACGWQCSWNASRTLWSESSTTRVTKKMAGLHIFIAKSRSITPPHKTLTHIQP